MKLYRYLSITKTEHIGRVISAVTRCAFYCSSPTSFNDPYEFYFIMDFSIDEADFRAWVIRNRPNDEEYNNLLRLRISPHEVESKKLQFINSIRYKYGVVCFCESVTNSLLWSYYANDHAGICIEIDFGQVPDDITLRKVQYVDEPPVYKYFSSDSRGAELCWMKSSIWRHEDEWRYVNHNHVGPIRFDDPVKVTGIYLGSRFAKCSIKDDMLRALKSSSSIVPIYQMKLLSEKFEVVPRFMALSNEIQLG